MTITIGRWRIFIKIFKITHNRDIQYYNTKRMYWNDWQKFTNNQ